MKETLDPQQEEEDEDFEEERGDVEAAEGEVEEEEEDEEEEDEEEEKGERGPNQAQEWETMAQAWISAFPEAKAVSAAEVETWLDSNFGSLPADLQSMPRSDLIDRLLSIQDYMRPLTHQPVAEASQSDLQHARFQRTDRWLPVYSWLESLDQDDVVKSKDISDWLSENPEIGEQLCSRHSKYHLFHYIRKCHMKILKRREKKKGMQPVDNPSSPKAEKCIETNEVTPFPSYPLSNLPKDSDLYSAKRNEALQKYQILLALEKKLSPHFSKPPAVQN